MTEKIWEAADDAVMQEDLEKITEDCRFCAEAFADRTVFVTGATGLLGSQVVKTLACFNRKSNTNIKILALVRNEEKARKIFGTLLDCGDVKIRLGDINQKIVIDDTVDYIIHGASPTSSKYFVSNPVETIHTALDGTTHVLEFAREKQVMGVLYLSSLEVYGTPDSAKTTIREQDYGYIEPLSARSSYSEGKRMVECLCASYASEYRVPVKIARLSQTFGPGVEYNDGRVFAEFARCAMERKDIVLHTAGNTVRSYCYTRDALEAFFYILIYGKEGEAYNVTNMETAVSIREMAQLVCDLFREAQIKVTLDMPEDLSTFGYNPEMVIRLDSGKLEALGWRATVGLEEMFIRLIKSMKRN